MIKWQKKGLVFSPSGNFGWMNSHAQVPAVLLLNDRFRIYFATRPHQGLSLTSFVDVDKSDPKKNLYIHDKPILELGKPGLFDEHGIMPSSVHHENGKVYLYYSGWQQSVGVPYNNYTGLAISEDEGFTFKKYSLCPILDRNKNELFSATSPTVLKISEKNWLMIYCSGIDWLEIKGKKEHIYDLKIATSTDGLKWNQTGKIAIAQNHPHEAITKASLYQSADNQFHLWYCYRGSEDFRDGKNAYRMGYAQSENGLDWQRIDEKSGISTSEDDWDSKMTAYPCVIEHNEKLLLFYNGNHFGKDGFGYAEASLNNILK